MVSRYPELERGESASQTGREHIPPRIFKEMTQLTKQKEQLDALLVGINPFNGKSRAAEISKVLDSYIPNVARMKDQLRKYNVACWGVPSPNPALASHRWCECGVSHYIALSFPERAFIIFTGGRIWLK